MKLATAQPAENFASGSEGERQHIAAIPRISIQAFCETPELAGSMQAAVGDRRMAKAHVKVQMGGLIGVGLMVSFEISTRSFETFLPQHKQVLDAVACRDPKLARATMDHLLTATYGYLERELAGSMKRSTLPA